MKVKIKVRSGKGGTELAVARVRITPTDTRQRPIGRALYQTRAQINVHLTNGNGELRTRNRPD